MSARRPPLRAIETFILAARSLSVTTAAEQLGITVSAASRRISDLERELGVDLFVRLNRRIDLTPTGREYLEAVDTALSDIETATDRLRQDRSRKLIRLTTMPLLASAWVLPRLAEFRRSRPDFDLDLQTGPDLVNFALSDVHAAVRFGFGNWPGLIAEKLMEADLTPICAPSLSIPLATPTVSALDRYVFLALDVPFPLWEEWFEAVGIPSYRPKRLKIFDDGQLMYEAAAAGMGLALGTSALTAHLLTTGRLVRAFETPPVYSTCAYYLVYRKRDEHWPPLRTLSQALKRNPDQRFSERT